MLLNLNRTNQKIDHTNRLTQGLTLHLWTLQTSAASVPTILISANARFRDQRMENVANEPENVANEPEGTPPFVSETGNLRVGSWERWRLES